MNAVFRARAARTGPQTYVDGVEHRDASEVFAPASMATWIGAPVTVGHPPGLVSMADVAALAVGFVRSARRDGEHVLVEIVITRPDIARDIDAGELVELSAGYTCDRIELDGRKHQVAIRINHLALGPPGWARCGSSCSIS